MTKITIEFNGSLLDKEGLNHQFNKEVDRLVDKTRDDLKDLLELSMRTGTLITMTDEQLRAFGKSTLIIKKSNELGATIVTSREHHKKLLQNYGAERIVNVSSATDAKGLSFPKGFLVDEGVDDEIIKELIRNGNKLIGGFKRL